MHGKVLGDADGRLPVLKSKAQLPRALQNVAAGLANRQLKVLGSFKLGLNCGKSLAVPLAIIT